ncbi:ABC transporter substrate-binding protein [Litorimonas sp. RW-G-Af-16]|uniref:ABC transporter substrate-binding protein n=1 Tax=Litorimonas sp. RW-G-Af-16 TaxID=3241168 RepID=UPI00390C93D1
MRIVSLDFCADQYVLKMVEPERILALSPDAAAPFSYMRDAAVGIPTVKSSAEDVMILKPDLVVRSYGGGPNANGFFQSAGVPVLNIGWAGDLEGIKRLTLDMADGLGAPEIGAEIVSDIDARLAALKLQPNKNRALYMTPSGITSGSGSMVHEILAEAGLENFQDQPGWRSIPLERLAYERPDMIAAAFFDTNNVEKNGWSAMRHPIARAQIKDLPTVALNGSWMSCGGWFVMDGIEALAERRYTEADL